MRLLVLSPAIQHDVMSRRCNVMSCYVLSYFDDATTCNVTSWYSMLYHDGEIVSNARNMYTTTDVPTLWWFNQAFHNSIWFCAWHQLVYNCYCRKIHSTYTIKFYALLSFNSTVCSKHAPRTVSVLTLLSPLPCYHHILLLTATDRITLRCFQITQTQMQILCKLDGIFLMIFNSSQWSLIVLLLLSIDLP